MPTILPTTPPKSSANEVDWFIRQRSAWVLLLLGMMLTTVAFFAVKNYEHQNIHKNFENEANRLRVEVQQRFYNIEKELQALAAWTMTTDYIDKEKFRTFVTGLHSTSLSRSVHGYAVLERISRGQVDSFTQLQKIQFPDYQVHAIDENTSDFLYPVKLIEPLADNRTALGLDIGSEKQRRQALLDAIDDGKPALTNSIILVQDKKKSIGFLYFIPVYKSLPKDSGVQQRRDALIAVVDAAIIVDELLAGATQSTNDQLDFELYEGDHQPSEPKMLFDADRDLSAQENSSGAKKNRATNRRFSAEYPFDFGDKTFHLAISSLPAFENAQTGLAPYLVLLSGTLLSSLFFVAFTSNSRARMKAESMAQDMTINLQRLALVAQRSTNGVIFTDSEKRITWTNEAYTKNTGYSLAESLGKTPADLLRADATDRQELARMTECLSNNQVYYGELQSRRKNGDIYWKLLQIHPIVDSEEKITGFMGIETDITQQKKSYSQIVRQQQMLEGMSQLARIGAWEYDIAKNRVSWSAMARAIHEVAADYEPTLEKTYCFCKADEHRKQLENAIATAMSDGKPYRLELKMTTATGREIWVLATGQGDIRDGKCVRLFGAIQDIDQHKRDEFALAFAATLNQTLATLTTHPAVLAGDFATACQAITNAMRVALQTPRTGIWLFSKDHNQLIPTAMSDAASATSMREDSLCRERFPNYFAQLEHSSQISIDDATLYSETSDLHDYLSALQISAMLDVVMTSGGNTLGVIKAEYRQAPHHWSETELAFLTSISALVGSLYSATEKRLAEEQLHISADRLQKLFELSPIGITLNDFDSGQFLQVNDALIAPSGYSKQEFIGLSYWDLTPKKYEAQEAQQLESMETTGRYGPYEKEYIRKDGTRYPVQLNGTVVHDLQGKRLIWSMVEDISLRKTQEQSIRQLFNQLERFFELSENFMCIASINGIVQKANHTFTRKLGYSEASLIGMNLLQLVHEDDREAAAQQLRRLSEGLPVFAYEARIRKTSGEYIHTQWFGASEPDTDSIYATAIDITAQHETLEALTQAKEAAEEASRLKGEFLATMSHEIRTPMNGVLGMLGLVLRGKIEDTEKKRLEIAYASAKSLLTILNDILDFSSIDSGKLSIERVDFEVMQLVEEVSATATKKAQEKNLAFHSPLLAAPTWANGDAGRLRQILNNLLDNAVKFTDHGSVTLECVLQQTTDHLRLIASIKDTGTGISPEKMRTLFEPFTQLDATTKRRHAGTGLGLAITKKLCERMGGKIFGQSEAGKGSSFTIEIPLQPAEPPATSEASFTHTNDLDNATPLNPGQSLSPESLPLPNKLEWPADTRALIVVESAVHQEELMALAKIAQLTTDVTASGLAAISALRNSSETQPYTLLLIACHLQEMDGYETARHIRNGRAGKRYQTIPIFGLQSANVPDGQKRAIEAGMNDMLELPLDPIRLHAKLSALLVPGPPDVDNAPAPAEKEVWNADEALTSLGGRKEMLIRLLQMLVERIPEQLTNLKNALAVRDYANAELIAHSVKGTAAQLKAHQLADTASTMENAAKENDEPQMTNTLPVFESHCEALAGAFRTFLQNPAP